VSRRRRRSAEVRLHLRLYPGQDDELIRWLEQFDDGAYGAKTQAVKDALLRGVGHGPERAAAPAGPGCVELSGQGLAEVRHVVEAALETALAPLTCALQGGGGLPPAAIPDEDDEAEDLLSSLGESLVLRN